ncbi:MAG: hypothetical protein E7527_07245 [Ruminococcaceae bacterium]|nr:hypothetical protein [Oscillospiraceae bacterium]
MKTRSSATNVVTAILASLLSVLLVVTLLGTSTAGLGSSLTKPEVLSHLLLNALQEVDFEEILHREAEGLGLSPNRYYEAKMAEEIMESDTMEAIVDLYAKDAAAAMTGSLTTPILTPERFRDLVERNAGELVSIVCRIDRSADPVAVKASLLSYVDENAEDLIGSMPVEEFAQDAGEVREAMELLSNFFIALLVISLVVGALIYACRAYRFGGFLWLGIDALLAGGLMGGAALLAKEYLAEEMFYKGDPEILEAVLSSFAGLIAVFALPLLVLGVVLIGLYILLRCTVVRKRLAAANAAIPAPVVPTAPAVSAMPVAPAPVAPVAPAAPTEPTEPNPQ